MKYFVRILIVLGYIPLGLLWGLLIVITVPINLIFLTWKFIITGSSDKVFLEDDIFDEDLEKLSQKNTFKNNIKHGSKIIQKPTLKSTFQGRIKLYVQILLHKFHLTLAKLLLLMRVGKK